MDTWISHPIIYPGNPFQIWYFDSPVPENKFPENGMPSQAAYEMIHQELNLDGIPELNLATCCMG